ncbi:MAG: hypothetical protein MZV63_21400 [Marinilabiliales bacterium]|nr:hypothetical protein [Marinilabiliales bacterium]
MVIVIIMTITVTMRGQIVETGLENLMKSNYDILKGKRVGLVTNPTGVDRYLRSTVDLLFRAPGCETGGIVRP